MKVYLYLFLIANCYVFVSKLSFCNALHLPEKSYSQLREELIREEKMLSFGSSLKLEGDEILANECLMAAKYKELDKGGWNKFTMMCTIKRFEILYHI